MCGFVGAIHPLQDVFAELHDGLTAIQHRGQDAAGILTYDGRFHIKKGDGLVRDVFSAKHLDRLKGTAGLGHVRYPTVGSGSADDAQPFLLNAPFGIAMVHNGNLTNCDELRHELWHDGHRHVNSQCDVEVVLNVFADELARQDLKDRDMDPEAIFRAISGVFRRAKGAYSVVALVGGQLVAFRDPYGIKPIIFGEREVEGGTAYCVASESVVLDLLDYHNTDNLGAGEAMIIKPGEAPLRRQLIPEAAHQPCLFEWVYFARPDSFLDRVSVYKTRKRLGKALAEEWRRTGLHADVVIPVPESSTTAAMAMANALGVKYREGLVKNRYIGRTFIMPNDSGRNRSIRHKLNPIQLEFQDKDVLLVDDSIVRGNTSRKIVQMAREAGARKVYFASYSPMLCFPCVYGIDMSTRTEFIARDRTPEEVAHELGADFVLYQTLDQLKESVREGNDDLKEFCSACFSGKYPTRDVTPEMLRKIENERLESKKEAIQDVECST